jgi:predicted GTPase
MSRWRIIVVVILLAAPLLVLAGAGSYFLWQGGWSLYLWVPLTGCMILGYLLAWYWLRKKLLLRPIDFTPPHHWTDRDREAWKLVEARAKDAEQLDLERLGQIQFYVDTAHDLSIQLAAFYHPGAKDPVGALTLPEILAVGELACHDLAELVDQYLPGSHLLTINDWRRARQLSDWYQKANTAYWLVSAFFSPLNTAARFAASKLGTSHPWQRVQQNLVGWFYSAFVHRLGSYLIDLNSGRLRIGARRYQELLKAAQDHQASSNAAQGNAVGHVTLTVLGQVKAGKSSVINALLGEQRALTDVIPATNQITRYELHSKEPAIRLLLLDTVGYGHTGPREDQLRATQEAAKQSDLLLLVLHARNPARKADLNLLEELRNWFAAQPDLKMPPVLAVMTHIDLLSPAMEWAPPYDWLNPERPKEQQIQQAWNALREQLGPFLVGIVPVCTDPAKIYGIDEWLLPTIVQFLDEARAVALLRCLHAEARTDKMGKVFRQLLETGKKAAQVLLANPPTTKTRESGLVKDKN